MTAPIESLPVRRLCRCEPALPYLDDEWACCAKCGHWLADGDADDAAANPPPHVELERDAGFELDRGSGPELDRDRRPEHEPSLALGWSLSPFSPFA